MILKMEDAAINAHGNNQFDFDQSVPCSANELTVPLMYSKYQRVTWGLMSGLTKSTLEFKMMTSILLCSKVSSTWTLIHTRPSSTHSSH